jgi:hypothetical protein
MKHSSSLGMLFVFLVILSQKVVEACIVAEWGSLSVGNLGGGQFQVPIQPQGDGEKRSAVSCG